MSADARSHLLAGIGLLIAGVWTLSLLDCAGKTLALMGFSIVLISWVRYFGHCVVLAAVFGPRHHGRLLRVSAPGLQVLRGLIMLATTVLFFSSLKRLPLAEATAINFCTPLFVVALAPLVLGETSRGSRWLGVALGFCGMLIVVRPGGQLDTLGVCIGLINALCNASYQLLTRKLATRDEPLAMLFWSGAVGFLVSSCAVPWFWPSQPLSELQWAIFVSTGLTGALGHYLVILAFRRAPAATLSPFMYIQIASATALGALVFGQRPDALSALGIAIICGGGLFVAFTEQRRLRGHASAVATR